LPQLTFAKSNCTKQALQDYFDNTWTLSEILLGSLQGEEAFMRPPYHDLRHPMIFYYGHPAALYVNKLRVAGLLKAPINPYFEVIFETGVDEMSWDDLSKNKMPWPSVAEVHAYRREVYQTVSRVIQSLSDEQCASIDQKSPLWALVLSFEHERIHLETSSYLISEMPKEFVQFPAGFPAYHSSVPSREDAALHPVAGTHYPFNEMLSVPAKRVAIGKPRDFPSFGWDNEYGYREYDLPAFKASKYKITNGEFLEFVQDGGYGRIELWTEAGWSWRAFR
jgi:5-histidylcysteine sulfoxide synthase